MPSIKSIINAHNFLNKARETKQKPNLEEKNNATADKVTVFS